MEIFWHVLRLAQELRHCLRNGANELCDMREALEDYRWDFVKEYCGRHEVPRTPWKPLGEALLNHLRFKSQEVNQVLESAERKAREQALKLQARGYLAPGFEEEKCILVWFAYYNEFHRRMLRFMDRKYYLPIHHPRIIYQLRHALDGVDGQIVQSMQRALKGGRNNQGKLAPTCQLKNDILEELLKVARKHNLKTETLDHAVWVAVWKVREKIEDFVSTEIDLGSRLHDDIPVTLFVYYFRDFLLNDLEQTLSSKGL